MAHDFNHLLTVIITHCGLLHMSGHAREALDAQLLRNQDAEFL